MTQNQLPDLVQKSCRLSMISGKHQSKLHSAIDKWFGTEFVRGMKLALLKQIFDAGAFEVFTDMLSQRSDADRIAILNKVDKHNPRVQMLSKKQSLEHLQKLASGAIKPLSKPRSPNPSRKRSPGKSTTKDLIAASKY